MMNCRVMRWRLVALAIAACVTGGTAAVAQDFPRHPKAITSPATGVFHDFVRAAPVSDGFVAAWNRVGDGKTSVFIRRFTAAGDVVGDPVIVEDGALAASEVEGRPTVVDLGADKIGIVWMGAGPALKGAVYDASTRELSAPVTYLSSGTLANVPHELALLENGEVALLTRRAVAGAEETTLFILDQSMEQVGAPQVVERDLSGNSKSGIYDVAVTPNRTGGVVIYRSADQKLMQRRIDKNGALRSPNSFAETFKLTPGTPAYAGFTVRSKPLPNRGYAVVTSEIYSGRGNPRKAFVRAFNRRGELIASEAVSYSLFGEHIQPDIFVFEQGFGVGWRNHPMTPGSTTQRAAFFDLRGKTLSKEIVTEYFGTDGPSGLVAPGDASEFVRLPNGDSLRLFIADRRIYGDRIPAAQVGMSDKLGVDRLKGTPGADVLLAGRGEDRVKGGDGDDLIDSGTETDVVDAGKGDDLIIANGWVHDVRQTVSGGPGADVFVIHPGHVKVLDFEKSDRLDVSMFNYATREDAIARAYQFDGYVYIEFSDQLGRLNQGAAVKLRNFKLKNLTAANIIN